MDREKTKERLEKCLIAPGKSISEAVRVLDRAGSGILVLCGEDRKLLGILTDGDIRRALLQHKSMDQPCEAIASKEPMTAPPDVSHSEAIHLLDCGRDFIVNQLPIVDGEGRIVDLWLRSDLVSEEDIHLHAVVMAGGFGKRLRPMTENIPKPMLPVGDRPVMEHIIGRLREAGIRHVNISTHFMPEKIKEHFGDGSEFGVDIEYVTEDRPLGTAGALGLMDTPEQPLLVVNGDVLTRVNYRAMLRFHRKHQADLTVGVRQYDLEVPYGVLECEEANVLSVREKPTYQFFVNAGIYLLEPAAHSHIPTNERFDMTDLIEKLIAEGRPVVSFPIMEYWLDIGQHEDYQQAQDDMESGRLTP